MFFRSKEVASQSIMSRSLAHKLSGNPFRKYQRATQDHVTSEDQDINQKEIFIYKPVPVLPSYV